MAENKNPQKITVAYRQGSVVSTVIKTANFVVEDRVLYVNELSLTDPAGIQPYSLVRTHIVPLDNVLRVLCEPIS